MKKLLFALVPVTILVLSAQLYCEEKKVTVAVSDLLAKNVSGMEASVVSDFIRDAFVNEDLFHIVERGNMERILAEQKLQMTGCTSTDCAVKLGHILNAQWMVIGSLSKIESVYYLNIRMVDVENGVLLASETTSANSLQEIHSVCLDVVDKIAKQNNGTPLPVKPDAQKPILSTGLGDLEIKTEFDKVQVFIDGDLKALAPANIKLLAGKYRVKLTKDEKAWEDTVTIKPFETTTINNPHLINALGKLQVTSYPVGARVILDDQTIGTTPLKKDINSGTYSLEVVKNGYVTYRERIVLTANKTTSIFTNLEKVEALPKIPTLLGIGFHYPGASIRLFTGMFTFEVKGSALDKLSMFGGRVYFNFNPRSTTIFYAGLEGDGINGETDIEPVTGTAFGGFVGMEVFASKKISVNLDLGQYTINLNNSTFTDITASGDYLVANVGINLYF